MRGCSLSAPWCKVLLLGVLLLLSPGVTWGAPDSDVRDATNALRAALQSGNQQASAEAAARLANLGGADAAEAIINLMRQIPPGQADALYWVLVHGLASFHDAPAAEAVRAYVEENDNRPISRDIMFALVQNPNAAMVVVHAWVLDEGPADLKPMAADALSQVRTPASVDALIRGLRTEENAGRQTSILHDRIVSALQDLTGQTYADAVNWDGWWQRNRQSGLQEGSGGGGTRSRSPGGASIEPLQHLSPDRVLVVTGLPQSERHGHAMDQIEDVLDRFHIPHRVIQKHEMDAEDFSFDGVMVLVINCIYWRELCICPDCRPGEGGMIRAFHCVCSRTPAYHEPAGYVMGERALQRIRAFVEGGGYLFTEDWMLEDCLTRIWPELVRPGPMLRLRDDDQAGSTTNPPPQQPQPSSGSNEASVSPRVSTQPARGMTSHPYLRRIFAGGTHRSSGAGATDAGGTQARGEDIAAEVSREWAIDDQSPAIHIQNENGVTRLMVSDEMASQLPQNFREDNSLAITFTVGRGTAGTAPREDPQGNGRPTGSGGTQGRNQGNRTPRELAGGGRVVHILSHFGEQGSSQDEFALQNLLLNFVNEAWERWQAAGGPP